VRQISGTAHRAFARLQRRVCAGLTVTASPDVPCRTCMRCCDLQARRCDGQCRRGHSGRDRCECAAGLLWLRPAPPTGRSSWRLRRPRSLIDVCIEVEQGQLSSPLTKRRSVAAKT
jgi:hypothetical protein